MTKEINKLWLVVNLATDEVVKIYTSKSAAWCWIQTHDLDLPDATGVYCLAEFNQGGDNDK